MGLISRPLCSSPSWEKQPKIVGVENSSSIQLRAWVSYNTPSPNGFMEELWYRRKDEAPGSSDYFSLKSTYFNADCILFSKKHFTLQKQLKLGFL